MRLSGKLRRFCKVLNADTADTAANLRCVEGHLSGINSPHGRREGLYKGHDAAYNKLHLDSGVSRSGQDRSEGRTSQAPRCLEPPPGSGTRSLVLERTLLRRARSCASQVRDAATRSARGRQQVRGRRTLRRFATDVLSSGSRLLQGWTGRAATQAARPQEPPQAHARSHGVHRSAVGGNSPARHSCPVSTDQSRTRPCRSSPQYRARSGAEKKLQTHASP